MDDFIDMEINEASSVPKYKQVIKSIMSNIEAGKLKYGQKIPSINSLSAEHYLSRDTVEKAYLDLKERGVIESVAGKGYYIRHSNPLSKIKVLIVFNKISAYKKVIYNRIVRELGAKAEVHLHVYHCEFSLFKQIVEQNYPGYDFYLIMPHFKGVDDHEVASFLHIVPAEKLIILDREISGLKAGFGSIFQDFRNDIYTSLNEGLAHFRRYSKITMVFPENVDYPYPNDILLGFRKFVVEHHFKFSIVSEIGPGYTIQEGEAFITIEETDLVQLIKKIGTLPHLKLGYNVGILSYNDTPLKEVLADGISVLTTDFEQMGEKVARMILNKQRIVEKNDFRLILRNSL